MPARLTADEVISLQDLAPLPGEGGYFRQTLYVPDPDQPGVPLTTAILFLVTPESWSGLHRLHTDELFHFYMGDPCRMVVCSPDGVITEHRLGTDLRSGCTVQVNVPGGMWQGTMLAGPVEYGYALLGTTMTPGFRPDQFELATEADLIGLPVDAARVLRPYLSSNQRAAPGTPGMHLDPGQDERHQT